MEKEGHSVREREGGSEGRTVGKEEEGRERKRRRQETE